MSLIVMKFGGTSVATPERIIAAAAKVAAEVARGHRVAVVVSAMAGVTNQLVDFCNAVASEPDPVEYDAVVASGEQVTSGLMAIALKRLGLESRSFQGWQVPVVASDAHGKARIDDIPPSHLIDTINAGIVPVIAGFQGVDRQGRIATLGRGGSDTSAVAVAATLRADRCDIYTDVDGVYTTDPRIVPGARKLDKISYEEMLEMATLGAKVLMNRSVELAMKWDVALQVLSTFAPEIGSDLPGTLVVAEGEIMEQEIVNGVAFSRNEAKISILNVPDQPGVAAGVFGPLAAANINVDMIVQNIAADGRLTDMTFTVPRGDVEKALATLKGIAALKTSEIRHDANVAKVSVVGIGMASHAGVAGTMFKALADKGVNIQVISTSEIKISVLIAEDYTELAVRALHAAYGLDREGAGGR